MNALRNIGSFLKRHFDFALLLAAMVEIPRWTVTFLAIHEPLWVGIPLGALLAYATSEGWRAYFKDTHRVKLLWFNIASLAAATFVITPVLFSMASGPLDEVDLAALLPFWWLLAWSAVLAVTTFAPLIQIAAVKSTPTETPTASATSTNTTLAPIATPAQSGGHSEGAGATPSLAEQASGTSAVSEGQPGKSTKGRTANPNRERALQMASEGFTAAEIAGMLNEKSSTVASWLYRDAQKNGVAK